MAATSNAAPGTEYGPCAEPCGHRDCAESRAVAATVCTECRRPIGYDVPFYRDNADGETDWKKLIHQRCMFARRDRPQRTEAHPFTGSGVACAYDWPDGDQPSDECGLPRARHLH